MPEHVLTSSGKKIYVDSRDSRGAKLVASGGDLNPPSLQLWNVGLAGFNWHTVIDVGFNYGEMLVSAQLPGDATLFAFEPNPRILPFSRRTLAEFGRPVSLIEAAVSDQVGESIPFSVDLEWSGTSGLTEKGLPPASGEGHDFASVDVPVTTLDATFIPLNPPSVAIKIDVEGHEMNVLRGAADLLNHVDKWIVMLEILHMGEGNIAQLTQRHNVFVLHRPSGQLVQIPAGRLGMIRRITGHPDIYGQDAILASHPDIFTGVTVAFSEVIRQYKQSRPPRAGLARRVARRLRRVMSRSR